jgi:hypothetical protein
MDRTASVTNTILRRPRAMATTTPTTASTGPKPSVELSFAELYISTLPPVEIGTPDDVMRVFKEEMAAKANTPPDLVENARLALERSERTAQLKADLSAFHAYLMANPSKLMEFPWSRKIVNADDSDRDDDDSDRDDGAESAALE